MKGCHHNYMVALDNLSASGGGGLHQALLEVATSGIHAGLSNDEMFGEIRDRMYGAQTPKDREIIQAIRKARNCLSDCPHA